MSFARTAFVPSYPYARSPDDPAGGGAPAAPAPATPAAPAAPAPAGGDPAPAPSATPAAPATPAAAAPVAPAPTTPSGAAATLAGATGAAPAPVAIPAKFPENWRADLAGDDKGDLKTLEGLSDPSALWKAYKELRTKLSSGELKAIPKPPGPDAKPEEIAAWRKDQGIPDKAEEYVAALKLENGVIPGEADKPLIADFAKAALAKGWKPEQFNQALDWYYGFQNQVIGQQQQADANFASTEDRELVREWGSKYDVHRTQVVNFLTQALPKDVFEGLLAGRTKDGRIIGNDAAFNKAMLEIARVVNPASTVLPNTPGANLGNVTDRKAQIEKNMRASAGTPEYNAYWRGESGAKMQEEYRGLIAAEQTMKERAAAPAR